MVKVENMTSPVSGKEVANQFIITTRDGRYFQSYASVIAFIPYDSTQPTELDKECWDYSTTTGRFRNVFLGENISETRKKINSGEYELKDLNN